MTDPAASYDLVILGAGPAGSAAARQGRRHGLSVLLIDKARFPRAKLCGGLFTDRARQIYERAFARGLPKDCFDVRTEVQFYMDGRDLGRVTDAPPMYLTMRWDMDAHLLDLAREAGADARLGTRVRQIDCTTDRLTLSDGTCVSYRVLVGADGVTSQVARALFGRAFDPKTIGFALEKEMPPTDDPDMARTIRVDFGAAAWGYGWSFPKAHSTTIGVGGVQQRNTDMAERFQRYAEDVAQGAPQGVKGHFLPFGDYRRRPGRGNVLLAGDAAGFVDPITGEGLAYALESGALAADAAARALREDRTPDTASVYRQATAPIRRALWMARRLRPIVFGRAFGPIFARGFANSTTTKSAYMDMMAGRKTYGDLVWLVLRRLPAVIWRTRRAKAH